MSEKFEDIVKSNTPHLDLETERRLTRSEQAIEDLDGNVIYKDMTIEIFRGLFREVDLKKVILEKINNLQVSEINDKKTSWPLIFKGISLVFVIAISLVGWGMSQQKTSAVNAAVVAVHHTYQTEQNKQSIEWNLRQNDRGHTQDKDISLLNSRISVGETEQAEDGRRLGILEDYSMTSMKDRLNHASQLKEIQIEIGVMKKTMSLKE